MVWAQVFFKIATTYQRVTGVNVSACYQRCIGLLDYIEEHLHQELDILSLSERASVSPFHLQRLFRELSGVSIAHYIKLLRFNRALHQLAYRPQMPVQDVALQSGYESAEAFSRALKQWLGQSPSEFRQHPNWSGWQRIYSVITVKNELGVVMPAKSFSPERVNFPELPLVVYEHRGDPANLPASIALFIAWRREQRLPPTLYRTFNLVYDDPMLTPAEQYRFDLAVAVDKTAEQLPPGFAHKAIPAGPCVRIRHQGNDTGLETAVRFLYADWLRENKEEPGEFPLFFERIQFFPDVPQHSAVTDIYLPLR